MQQPNSNLGGRRKHALMETIRPQIERGCKLRNGAIGRRGAPACERETMAWEFTV